MLHSCGGTPKGLDMSQKSLPGGGAMSPFKNPSNTRSNAVTSVSVKTFSIVTHPSRRKFWIWWLSFQRMWPPARGGLCKGSLYEKCTQFIVGAARKQTHSWLISHEFPNSRSLPPLLDAAFDAALNTCRQSASFFISSRSCVDSRFPLKAIQQNGVPCSYETSCSFVLRVLNINCV